VTAFCIDFCRFLTSKITFYVPSELEDYKMQWEPGEYMNGMLLICILILIIIAKWHILWKSVNCWKMKSTF